MGVTNNVSSELGDDVDGYGRLDHRRAGASGRGQEFLGGILLEFLVSSFASVRIAAAAW